MTDASNASQVKDELQQLHTAFEEFARAQVAYHNRLVDLYNIEESNEYFKSVEQSQGQLAGEVARWIVSSNGTDSNNCLKSNGCDGIDTIIPYQSINH